MLENFKGFVGYSEDEFKNLWEDAIIVVDTNILIRFYKYTSKSLTMNLLKILQKLKQDERLWIPHQVALEYFFNWEDNINIQKESYNELEKQLLSQTENVKKSLTTVENKHPYIDIDKFEFIKEDIDKLNEKLKEEIKSEVKDLSDTNKIHNDLLELLDGIVGEPYKQNEIDEVEEEGEERYKNNIPPGFLDAKDKEKNQLRRYADISYHRLYGDLIVWKQIIDKVVKSEEKKPVIFITEDRKEDWWEIKNGKIKRPHRDLIQEFLNETGQHIYLYRTNSFVENAKIHLDINVTEEEYEDVMNNLESMKKTEEEFLASSLDYYSKYLKDIDNKNLEELMNTTTVSDYKSVEDFINNIKSTNLDDNLDFSNHDRIEKLIINNELHNYTNKNYKSILKKADISLSQLMDYLTFSEKKEARNKIEETMTRSNNREFYYNRAIEWIFRTSLPHLKNELTNLNGKIALMNLEDAEKYLEKIDQTPPDVVEKGIELLKLISEMKTYIKYEGLLF